MDFEDRVEHGYAVSKDGTKLHYATLGEGPLLVMVHGFPDFWYTWRHQMEALSSSYTCVAMDTRGYNLSDKPQGVEMYSAKKLGEDIMAIIDHFGEEKAILCGHDYGAGTSWRVGIFHPERLEKLIILNLPHPKGLSRELANNPEQVKVSEYARNFMKDGFHETLNAEELADWVTDPQAKAKYVEAFERSDFEAMMNYYKASYPREPYKELPELPKIDIPVLQIHGLQDHALLPGGLNDTWLWMGKDYTLVTIPDSGHYVQQDAADMVTRTMRSWLGR